MVRWHSQIFLKYECCKCSGSKPSVPESYEELACSDKEENYKVIHGLGMWPVPSANYSEEWESRNCS